MEHRYLALLSASQSARQEALLACTASLGLLGLHPRLSSGRLTLFVSEATPVIPASDGSVLLGNLFSTCGTPVGPNALSNFPSGQLLTKHILDNCWGEYLLVQPAHADTGSVKVSRDPSGGIGCVYSIDHGVGFITSDISIAISLGLYRKAVDWDFIGHAVVYPYLKTRRTGFSKVQELLPGCSLSVSRNAAAVQREWSPWDFTAHDERHHDPQEAAESIRKAISMAVSSYAGLEQSILVELSGGLDSSIVATCLRNVSAEVACCTVVTPVPGADERRYAELVANKLGFRLEASELGFDTTSFRFPTPANAVEPRIGMLQHVMDETVTAIASRQGATSFFSGGGGDTVFGYLYGASPAADAFRERGLLAGMAAARDLSTMHNCTLWKASRLSVRKLARPTLPVWKAERSLLGPSTSDVRPEDHPWLDPPDGALTGDVERMLGLVATQSFRESAPRRLRLPLLSQPVVEACLRVPTWMCILGGNNRSVARSAFADLLPDEVLNRRSKGSFTSYYGAVYQRSKPQIRDFLQTGHLVDCKFLDAKALHAFLDDSRPLRDRSFTRAFDLCMIENWIQNQI